ncbi:MAG: hypothetical protein OXU36_23425 [Candidatus Poribacteria bacterium]|nr:hypothetical protein [Candidatus Poribacteria bacterium]
MLNVRATLWRIFGILFIFFITVTAFAQREQQPAALSQSQFEKILEKIEESEDEMRTHVDQKFNELDEKVDKLDEKVDEIKTDVAVLNARVNLLQWVIAIIGAPFLISIIVLFVQIRLNQRNSVEITPKVATESREELDEDAVRRNPIDNRPPEAEIA